MLDVLGVETFYSDSHVLRDVSLRVEEGRVAVLLGRNGAGKTTAMRSIMGLTPPRAGRILLDGREISRLPTYQIARAGLGFVPAGRRVFGDLTVLQNLKLAGRSRHGGPPRWGLSDVLDLFPKLRDLSARPARFLSGGEQQMLKLGRCLLSDPRVLLLDEPTEGLAPIIVRELFDRLRALRDAGLAILVAEQNVRSAMRLSDHCYVLEKGQIRFSGPAQQLESRPELGRYLGV